MGLDRAPVPFALPGPAEAVFDVVEILELIGESGLTLRPDGVRELVDHRLEKNRFTDHRLQGDRVGGAEAQELGIEAQSQGILVVGRIAEPQGAEEERQEIAEGGCGVRREFRDRFPGDLLLLVRRFLLHRLVDGRCHRRVEQPVGAVQENLSGFAVGFRLLGRGRDRREQRDQDPQMIFHGSSPH